MTDAQVDYRARKMLAELLQAHLHDDSMARIVVSDLEILASTDQAVRGILDRLKYYNPVRYSSQQKSQAKEGIERAITFLNTDLEYLWRVSLWKQIVQMVAFMASPFAFIVGLFGVFTGVVYFREKLFQTTTSKYDVIVGLILALIYCGALVGFGYFFNRILERLRKTDHNYWPFINREQYEQGLEKTE